MEQNYFQFQQKCFKQTEGLAMGAPTSAILTGIYIQNMEHKQIYPMLLKHKIIGYFRYVDDILLIYNQNKTNIEEILTEFNKQQPTIKFTIKKETQIHKLPRPNNTTRAETRIHNTQKTHTDRHYNTKRFMPCARTQNIKHQLPNEQTQHIPNIRRSKEERTQHHQKHTREQQI
jgi:hypothetical protein